MDMGSINNCFYGLYVRDSFDYGLPWAHEWFS
jgi:hypothetical protein